MPDLHERRHVGLCVRDDALGRARTLHPHPRSRAVQQNSTPRVPGYAHESNANGHRMGNCSYSGSHGRLWGQTVLNRHARGGEGMLAEGTEYSTACRPNFFVYGLRVAESGKALSVGKPLTPNCAPSVGCASASTAPSLTTPASCLDAFSYSGASFLQCPHLRMERWSSRRKRDSKPSTKERRTRRSNTRRSPPPTR
jgi:hypothetical protein